MHATKIAAALLLVAALNGCTNAGPRGEAAGGGTGGVAGTGDAGGTAGIDAGGMTAGSGGTGGDQGGSADSAINGAGGNGGDAGPDPEDAGTSGPDSGLDPNGCVVAQRVDDCCWPWIAVEQATAEAELCIVSRGEPTPYEGCTPPMSCALVDCAPPAAPTSFEASRGDGACMFADECSTDADCAIGTAWTGCCTCPASMPKSLIDQELCITAEGEDADFEVCSGNTCFTVLCAPCPALAEPTCVMGDDYNRCR
jgi:hypothetical protein